MAQPGLATHVGPGDEIARDQSPRRGGEGRAEKVVGVELHLSPINLLLMDLDGQTHGFSLRSCLSKYEPER